MAAPLNLDVPFWFYEPKCPKNHNRNGKRWERYFTSGSKRACSRTTIGVVTDFDGQYSIDVPENAEKLKFSYLGYITREELINDRSVINIKLQSDATGLDEIVVVGYGTQKASEITGSISTVKAEEIADIPVQQITQKIQGKVSGVQISQTTGVPGRGLSVRIRRQASISAGNGPLYVLSLILFKLIV